MSLIKLRQDSEYLGVVTSVYLRYLLQEKIREGQT